MSEENRKASTPTRPSQCSLDTASRFPKAQISPNYSERQWGDTHTHKLLIGNLLPQPGVGAGNPRVGRRQPGPCHLRTTARSGGKWQEAGGVSRAHGRVPPLAIRQRDVAPGAARGLPREALGASRPPPGSPRPVRRHLGASTPGRPDPIHSRPA